MRSVMRNEEIHTYLHLRKSVRPELVSRIDEFYHYKWATHGGVDGDTKLFADLHPQLRDELVAAECDEVCDSSMHACMSSSMPSRH